jgi:formylglycine-generating enzyme required for sulfatase activity
LKVAIRSAGGEQARELEDGALLLALQRGSAVTAVAVIGVSHGTPYLQPLDGEVALFLNSHRLGGSQWLRDGDRLEAGGRPISVAVAENWLALTTDLKLAMRRAPASISLEPPAEAAVRQQRRMATPLAFVALAGLALLAWFLFSARMVYVDIQPVPDRVSLDGAVPVIPIGAGYLALGGKYRLHAERAGYRVLDTEIEVTDASRQQISIALEKLPGYLSVEVPGVADATVLIDGTVKGVAPVVDADLAPGEHQVVVRASGYVEYARTLAIEGLGRRQKLSATLVAAAAPLTVQSNTAGAMLWIDGEQRSGLPLTVELAAGTHAVEIRAPAHKTWKQEVTIVPAQPQSIGPVSLAPADGSLTLASDPTGASVAVDGRYAGTTPLVLSLMPDREHRIELSMRGRETAQRTVRLAAAETREFSVSLGALTGQVRLEVEPRDAVLVIEGRSYGPANGVHALPALPQLLEITRDGFASGRLWVTPKPGFAQTLRVTLRAAGTPATEELPERITAPDGTVMVLLRPAPFSMGASRREPGQRANETLHRVKLVRPFYIGATEVTNEQFRRFRPRHDSGRYGSLWLDGPAQPAVNVRWEEAAAYCNSLNAAAKLPEAYAGEGGGVALARPVNRGFRLPTEAEWAWAARRAGASRPARFPWGDVMPPPPRSGNFADRSVAGVLADTVPGYDDGYAGSAPVGRFAPNAAGLYDMAGNAAEWVNDFYAIQAPSEEETDPTGPPGGKHHVIRGSSWMQSSISALRWTYRDYGADPRPDVGFRCARYAREAP